MQQLIDKPGGSSVVGKLLAKFIVVLTLEARILCEVRRILLGIGGIKKQKAEVDAELVKLRERVKVLERIATDPARRTAEEIDKLRDE